MFSFNKTEIEIRSTKGKKWLVDHDFSNSNLHKADQSVAKK